MKDVNEKIAEIYKPVEPKKPSYPDSPKSLYNRIYYWGSFPVVNIFLFLLLNSLRRGDETFSEAFSEFKESLFEEAPLSSLFLVTSYFILAFLFIRSLKDIHKDRKTADREYAQKMEVYKRRMEDYEQDMTQYKKKCDLVRKEHEDWIESVRKGTAEFPAMEFYNKCSDKGITNIENEYDRQKAIEIVGEIFNGLSYADYEVYVSNLDKYYKKGEKLAKIDNRKPKQGEIPNYLDYKEIYQYNNRYGSLSYNSKRFRMIKDNIDALNNKIKSLQRSEEATMKAASKFSGSYDTKPSNAWAYVGGAASAIGGPVAGALAAAEVKHKDDMRVAANKAASQEMYNGFLKVSVSQSNKIIELQSAVSELQEELDSLSSKKIMRNHSQEELLGALNLKTYVTNTSSDKYTSFKIVAKNSFSLGSVFDDDYAIDGTLLVRILCDKDTVIDTLRIPLPCSGIRYGNRESLTGISRWYMKGEHKRYRAEIASSDLWITEI